MDMMAEQQRVRADLIAAARARQAIEGWTAEQRLRWIVEDFLRRDLRSKSPEDRAAIRWRLRALTPEGIQSGYDVGEVRGGEVVVRYEPGAVEALVALQGAVRQAVQAAADGSGWELPPVVIRVNRLSGDDPRTPARYHELWDAGETNIERNALIFALYRLIPMGAGFRLYRCRVCRRPYVRYRKQLYCSQDCTRKVLHQKKAAKRKQARADQRHARSQRKMVKRAATTAGRTVVGARSGETPPRLRPGPDATPPRRSGRGPRTAR